MGMGGIPMIDEDNPAWESLLVALESIAESLIIMSGREE
jgi:hypothetical protein